MAYAALPTKNAGDTITLATYNVIKANFEAGVPDTYTTKGDIVSASAANTASRLAVGANDSIIVADSAQTGNLAWQIIPAVRVTQAADQALGAAAFASITFDTEVYDTDAMHNPAVEPTRLTCPTNGDGIYFIQGNVEFDNNGGVGQHEMAIRILLNGATVIAEVYDNANEDDANISLYVATDYALAATDYVELQGYTEKNDNVKYVSAHTPVFSARWVRRP